MKNVISSRFLGYAICLILIIQSNCAFSQSPSIQWAKCYGGSGIEAPISVCQTSDKGYVLGGFSNSSDSQVTGNHGSLDCWLLKLDSLGGVLWEKSYGGTGDEQINQVTKDINGGYIIAASTASSDGDIHGYHGNGDAWLIRIDDTGHIVWDSVMGSTGMDFFNYVINTPDSGYIVVGSSGAANGNVPINFGQNDIWILKLSKNRTVEWNKVYGGSGNDYAYKVLNTIDGKYIVCGYTEGGGIISGYRGNGDAWLLKLNDTGAIEWQKCYGGSNVEGALSIVEKSSGKYFVGCPSKSNDGQVSGNHGDYDFWVFAVNDTGNLLWERSFGGSGYDYLYDLELSIDSNLILTGATETLDGDVTSTRDSTGGADFWVLKINDTGNIVWENTFGGSRGDTSTCIIQTVDSGYAVAGYTNSNNWDVSGNHGATDYWVLKLHKDPPTKIEVIQAEPGIQVYPTLTTGMVHIDLPNDDADYKFQLVDMSGREIKTIVSGIGASKSILANFIPDGMYILNVIHGRSQSSFKICFQGSQSK